MKSKSHYWYTGILVYLITASRLWLEIDAWNRGCPLLPQSFRPLSTSSVPRRSRFEVHMSVHQGKSNGENIPAQEKQDDPTNTIRHRRRRKQIYLKESGRDVTIISRTVPITSDWSITVWEWENPSEVVNSYWEAYSRNIGAGLANRSPRSPSSSSSSSLLLDPFGLVLWPGSVVAAQEMQKWQETAIQNQRVLVLGAGVGIETQAAAMLGAKKVLATDIHPTTIQQLEVGVTELLQQTQDDHGGSDKTLASGGVVETKIFDLFSDEALPRDYDLIVIADVLYNERLASQVCRRIVEAGVRHWQQQQQQEGHRQQEGSDSLAKDDASGKKLRVLITDSQRLVPGFLDELNRRLQDAQIFVPTELHPLHLEWKEQELIQFTGSGVSIDDDQTYDIKVRTLWIEF